MIYCWNHRKKAIFQEHTVGASIRLHWRSLYNFLFKQKPDRISIHWRSKWDIAHFIQSINLKRCRHFLDANSNFQQLNSILFTRECVTILSSIAQKTQFPLRFHVRIQHLFIRRIIYSHMVPPMVRIPSSHLPPFRWLCTLHIQYITNSVNALNEKNTIYGKQSVASSAILFPLIYNTLRKYKLVAMTALWSRRVCLLRTIFEYFRLYVIMRLIQLIQYERNIFVVVAFNNNSSRCHGQRHIASQYCVAYWAEIKILENDMI